MPPLTTSVGLPAQNPTLPPSLATTNMPTIQDPTEQGLSGPEAIAKEMERRNANIGYGLGRLIRSAIDSTIDKLGYGSKPEVPKKKTKSSQNESKAKSRSKRSAMTATRTDPINQDQYSITTDSGIITRFTDYLTPSGAIFGSSPILDINRGSINFPADPDSPSLSLSRIEDEHVVQSNDDTYTISPFDTHDNPDTPQDRVFLITQNDNSGQLIKQLVLRTNSNGDITDLASVAPDNSSMARFSSSNSGDPDIVATGTYDIYDVIESLNPDAQIYLEALTSSQPSNTAEQESGSGFEEDDFVPTTPENQQVSSSQRPDPTSAPAQPTTTRVTTQQRDVTEQRDPTTSQGQVSSSQRPDPTSAPAQRSTTIATTQRRAITEQRDPTTSQGQVSSSQRPDPTSALAQRSTSEVTTQQRAVTEQRDPTTSQGQVSSSQRPVSSSQRPATTLEGSAQDDRSGSGSLDLGGSSGSNQDRDSSGSNSNQSDPDNSGDFLGSGEGSEIDQCPPDQERADLTEEQKSQNQELISSLLTAGQGLAYSLGTMCYYNLVQDQQQSQDQDKTALIAGATVGAVAGLALTAFGIHRYRNRDSKTVITPIPGYGNERELEVLRQNWMIEDPSRPNSSTQGYRVIGGDREVTNQTQRLMQYNNVTQV